MHSYTAGEDAICVCARARVRSSHLPPGPFSEAKTEIMCLGAKRCRRPPSYIHSVAAAGQVYNQMNEFVYLGGNANHNADLPIEVDRRIYNAWCSFRKYTFELYD